MVPGFGFPVGDIIATIGLIAKVAQALDESAGALQNYQDVQIELHALEETLRHLQALKPNEHNRAHVDVIHGIWQEPAKLGAAI
ncbi:hypothetical protein TW65_06077 [Stemphylium lycopersici]|nr:hypothetical protein TW65_06077 [Stemphylium lycopersici]